MFIWYFIDVQTYWCSNSTACQEKRTTWIFKIFSFTDKNPFYLPRILALQFILRVKVIKE